MQDTVLIKEVFLYGQPGMSVLDIGAGSMDQAREFKENGYQVTALDTRTPKEIPVDINFIEANFLSWEPDKKYDILFFRNSVQFMDKQELLSKIIMMEPKIIAIEAFYGPPEPDFPEQYSMIFYTLDDFEKFPGGYTPMLLQRGEVDRKDMKGTPRRFKILQYIGLRQH